MNTKTIASLVGAIYSYILNSYVNGAPKNWTEAFKLQVCFKVIQYIKDNIFKFVHYHRLNNIAQSVKEIRHSTYIKNAQYKFQTTTHKCLFKSYSNLKTLFFFHNKVYCCSGQTVITCMTRYLQIIQRNRVFLTS